MSSIDSLRFSSQSVHSKVKTEKIEIADDTEEDEEEEDEDDLELGDTSPLVSSRDREIAKAAASDRAALFGNMRKQSSSSVTAQLPPTSKVTRDLHSVDSAIDRTTRALAETERYGQLTTAQLLIQRESFLRQRQQLSQTDEYMARTKSILQRMQFRLVTDKIVQGVIIMVELAAIGAIIYFKYYKK